MKKLNFYDIPTNMLANCQQTITAAEIHLSVAALDTTLGSDQKHFSLTKLSNRPRQAECGHRQKNTKIKLPT